MDGGAIERVPLSDLFKGDWGKSVAHWERDFKKQTTQDIEKQQHEEERKQLKSEVVRTFRWCARRPWCLSQTDQCVGAPVQGRARSVRAWSGCKQRGPQIAAAATRSNASRVSRGVHTCHSACLGRSGER